MKKGLRRCNAEWVDETFGFSACPDEEGIKTNVSSSCLSLSLGFSACPDEEGIKTQILRAASW